MLQIDILPQPGDALVNASACFPDTDLLQRDFDILVFLEFCAGLDAAVLHNRLHTIGSLAAPRSSPVTKALLEEGVLEFHMAVASDVREDASRVLKNARARSLLESTPNRMSRDPSSPDVSMIVSAVDMVMDVVLEQELELPLVLPTRWAGLYLLLPDVREEQRAWQELELSLARQYSDLRDVLLSLRGSFDADNTVPVPPIALEVLRTADDLSQLPEALLNARRRYTRVRRRFAELDELLRAADVDLKTKYKERAKMLKSIRALATDQERDAITVLSSFGRKLNESTKVAAVSDGTDLDDINWTKVIGYLINAAETAYWKFRMRPLHGTKKRYLRMSPKEIEGVVQKHFPHVSAQREVRRSSAYAARVDELLREVGAVSSEGA